MTAISGKTVDSVTCFTEFAVAAYVIYFTELIEKIT